MGQCCPHSYDFHPETNIKDESQAKKEDAPQPKKEDAPQPKKEDAPVYHIRRISNGKLIILRH
jgi:hypothetical protein